MTDNKLKNQIINLALKHLRRHSAQDLSLRELAKRAGVSEAAPYRHFKNKDHLLTEIALEGHRLKYDYMLEAFQSTKDPIEQLHRIGQAYLLMGIKHPEHFKLMCTGPIRPIPKYKDVFAQAKVSYFLLFKVLLACQTAKKIGKHKLEHLATHCWVTVHGFTALYVYNNLNWLGVKNQNVKLAMRSITEELLVSFKSPPKRGTPFNFRLDRATANFIDSLNTGSEKFLSEL